MTSCVSPGFNWTHDWVKGTVLSDGIIMLVSFLIAEGNTDSSGKVEARIGVVELDGSQEEMNVMEGYGLGVVRTFDLGVFTTVRGKEKSTNAEVGDGFVKFCDS
jgi:hypothetical protein